MDPDVRSSVETLGLWQFMKGTVRNYGLRVTWKIDEHLDVEKSTHVACLYLKDAYSKLHNWVAVANRYVYCLMAVKIIFTHPATSG